MEVSAGFVRLALETPLVSLPPLCPPHLHADSSDLEVSADTVAEGGTDLCLYGPAIVAAAHLLVAHCFAGVEAGAELQAALVLCFLLAAYLIRQGVALAARLVVIVRKTRTAVVFRRA